MTLEERWTTFSLSQQALMIASELSRARSFIIQEDRETYKMLLERALELLDLAINDSRWKGKRHLLLDLREGIGFLYAIHPNLVITRNLYDAFLLLSEAVVGKSLKDAVR